MQFKWHNEITAAWRHQILLVCMLVLPLAASAQVADNSRRVDTLSLAERISVRTNLVDWGLLVPNIGVEFDIRNTNWNRYAVNANFRYRPHTNSTYVRGIVYNLFEATLEGRVYWRERKCTPTGYLSPHRHWIDKLWSCRNMLPSHPNWVFYRGGYVTYSKYSMLWGGGEGRQGTAYMAGVTWGFVKPFLAFQNGNSMDMEFGFSAGVMYNKYDTYRADRENNCYPKTGHEDGKFGPMLRDLHVALVYRFGNYPIQKKYRWRYDVDMDFREKKDSIYNAWLTGREQKYIQDSIYRVVAMEFRQLYDSCVDVRHREQQQAIDEQAPARVPNYTPKQLAKMRKDSIKQARLDSINAIKKARRDSLAKNDPKLAKKFAEEDAREARQQEMREKIERSKAKAKEKAKDAQATIERQRAKREAAKKAEEGMTKEEKAAARKAKAQAAQEKIARMRARREAAKKAAEEAKKSTEEGGTE
ncbi:MAG: DUF3575 domain-containing protein [Prevotella sp.]|nr:DUF3575 domain-containing protein [Prevotella sp.]